jgi:hypothetical protein
MLARLVTRERLDRGIFASAKDGRETCFQSLGLFLLAYAAWQWVWNEGRLEFREWEVAEARDSTITLSCDTTQFGPAVGQLIHLPGCAVRGARDWMQVDATANLLAGFASNFVNHQEDLRGIEFRMKIVQV